jgi:hypothetical protein
MIGGGGVVYGIHPYISFWCSEGSQYSTAIYYQILSHHNDKHQQLSYTRRYTIA